MLRQEKHDFVLELEEIYKKSNSIILTHYHGLTMSQLTGLRNNLRKSGGEFKVVKNTLSKIAINKIGLNSCADMFAGPIGVAYSSNAIETVKDIVAFNKANNKLKIIGGIIENKLISEQDIQKLSKLPSLNELRGQIVGILQAPASNIVRILQAPPTMIVRILKAYSEK